jgi:phosphoglycolate phosphatase
MAWREQLNGIKKMNNIYFDLDGTLIDCSKRNYMVYEKCTIKLGGYPLSFNDYWRRKRKKEKFESILSDSLIQNNDKFFEIWFKEIESYKNLVFDKPFPFTVDVLDKLINNNNIYLVTLRRKPKNLIKELKYLDLYKYFTDIHVGNENLEDKYSILKKIIKEKTASVIIGDTELDIEAAKRLRVKCIAVSSGIRSAEYLMKLNPDVLVNDISEITKLKDIT